MKKSLFCSGFSLGLIATGVVFLLPSEVLWSSPKSELGRGSKCQEILARDFFRSQGLQILPTSSKPRKVNKTFISDLIAGDKLIDRRDPRIGEVKKALAEIAREILRGEVLKESPGSSPRLVVQKYEFELFEDEALKDHQQGDILNGIRIVFHADWKKRAYKEYRVDLHFGIKERLSDGSLRVRAHSKVTVSH